MPKDQQFTIGVVDGRVRVIEVAAGEAPPAVFTVTPADAEAIERGELDVNVGYMQGRIKAAGDMKVVLDVLHSLRLARPL